MKNTAVQIFMFQLRKHEQPSKVLALCENLQITTAFKLRKTYFAIRVFIVTNNFQCTCGKHRCTELSTWQNEKNIGSGTYKT